MDRVTLFDIVNDWPSFSSFRAADPLFGDTTRQIAGPTGSRALTTPARPLMRGMLIDLKENDKGFEIKADIPGVDKSEIMIDTSENVLTLEVKHSEEKETGGGDNEGDKMHCIERSSYFQKRSMRLPLSADLSKTEATYENGVLSVTIPHREEEALKSRRIAVQ